MSTHEMWLLGSSEFFFKWMMPGTALLGLLLHTSTTHLRYVRIVSQIGFQQLLVCWSSGRTVLERGLHQERFHKLVVQESLLLSLSGVGLSGDILKLWGLSSLSIEGDAIPNNCFDLALDRPCHRCDVTRSSWHIFCQRKCIFRSVRATALTTSWLLGSSVCLNVAVLPWQMKYLLTFLLRSTSTTWGLVLKTFTHPRKSRLSLVSRQVR